MDCPFQVRRFPNDDPASSGKNRYFFVLVNTRTDAAITNCYSNSPIAPKSLRDFQAQLNTKAALG